MLKKRGYIIYYDWHIYALLFVKLLKCIHTTEKIMLDSCKTLNKINNKQNNEKKELNNKINIK